VDDDPFFLELLKDNLVENPRLDISWFGTGEACLAEMNKQPSIVVLDFYLNRVDPDAQNGHEILKKILDDYPDTKVIMLTGQDSLSRAESMMDSGASFYITKDKDAPDLIERKINLILKSL